MLLFGDYLIRLLIPLERIKSCPVPGRLVLCASYQNAASNGASNIDKRSNAASKSCGM